MEQTLDNLKSLFPAQVTITAGDMAGRKTNIEDCRGARCLKRIIGTGFDQVTICCHWGDDEGFIVLNDHLPEKYISITSKDLEGRRVDMMRVEEGAQVIFDIMTEADRQARPIFR